MAATSCSFRTENAFRQQNLLGGAGSVYEKSATRRRSLKRLQTLLGQEVLSRVVFGAGSQAAFFLIPSSNLTPWMTSARSAVAPLSARHVFCADIVSLKTIVRHARRLPLPFVFAVRRRTVAKVDSIGLVVRR